MSNVNLFRQDAKIWFDLVSSRFLLFTLPANLLGLALGKFILINVFLDILSDPLGITILDANVSVVKVLKVCMGVPCSNGFYGLQPQHPV